MAGHHWEELDQERILVRLGHAQDMIRAGRFVSAIALYRGLLTQPVLNDLPVARTEILSNLGALLLHEAHESAAASAAADLLDEAIDLLARAHAAYRLGEGSGNGATSDTNLALAYFRRHLARGNHADLMSAHLALDGAEAAFEGVDSDALDWVRSIRDLLVGHADRRRR